MKNLNKIKFVVRRYTLLPVFKSWQQLYTCYLLICNHYGKQDFYRNYCKSYEKQH